MYVAVYTVSTRPWAAVYRPYTAALGRVQTVYTAVHGPCTWSVRVPNTVVYAACRRQNTAGYAARTRPCTYRIYGRARAVYRVHGCLHGRLYGPCARPCTYHVHGRAWSVHDPNTAVYTFVYPVHAMATTFFLSMGYNFGCMIASNTLFSNTLFNSRGGFSGSNYPMKTYPILRFIGMLL